MNNPHFVVSSFRYFLSDSETFIRFYFYELQFVLSTSEIDSAFSRNEYQEYLLGVNTAGAYG
jgi:hypothetical protein